MLKRIFAVLSLQRTGFDARPVHVRFVVDEVTLRQGFLKKINFFFTESIHQYSVLVFVFMPLM